MDDFNKISCENIPLERIISEREKDLIFSFIDLSMKLNKLETTCSSSSIRDNKVAEIILNGKNYLRFNCEYCGKSVRMGDAYYCFDSKKVNSIIE